MPLHRFDMDGVFADMTSALDLEADTLFATAIEAPANQSAQTPDAEGDAAEADDPNQRPELELSSCQQRALWRRVTAIDCFLGGSRGDRTWVGRRRRRSRGASIDF